MRTTLQSMIRQAGAAMWPDAMGLSKPSTDPSIHTGALTSKGTVVPQTIWLAGLLSCILAICPLGALAADLDDPEQAGQFSVVGKGVSLTNGQTAAMTSDGTDFGAIYTDNVHSRLQTYTIQNSGDAALSSIAVAISGTGADEFFINTAPATDLDTGDETTLRIRFTSDTEGFHQATVTISSPDSAEDFSFVIHGVADSELRSWMFCETCGGIYADSENVCSGNGTCLGNNLCDCSPGFEGTNCETENGVYTVTTPAPYTDENGDLVDDRVRWDTGKLVALAGFDFSPRIFLGPEIKDPEGLYIFRVKINSLDNFPGSIGMSIGLLNIPPPDISHDIGFYGNEYGYLGGTGQKFFGGATEAYGQKYYKDDIVTVIYDAAARTARFTVERPGVSPVDQGLAFEGVQTVSGKSLYLGLSVTCFGSCNFELVE